MLHKLGWASAVGPRARLEGGARHTLGRGHSEAKARRPAKQMPSPDKEWVLRVPFTVAPALSLRAETTESFGEIQLTLRPEGSGYNCFLFEGLATIGQARHLFLTLKTGALTAGLYAGCGVRITDDLLELDESTPLPVEADRPMAYRLGQDLRWLVLNVGEPRFVTSRVLPRFMDGLRTGLTAEPALKAMQDPQVQLASLLYADSHFEKSPQARFIGLIGVLEVLKDQRQVSPATQELIDRWIDEVKEPGLPEARSLRQRLGYLKTVSISQGIRSLTQRHLGDEAARNVVKLYGYRSRLVHDGAVTTDLGSALEQAEALVRQLLARILSTGAR
jgi:hypothetical protein